MNFLEVIITLKKQIEISLSKFHSSIRLSPDYWIFIHYLERVQSNLNSLEILYKNDFKAHYHSVGLICRNLLSDLILINYFVYKSEKNPLRFVEIVLSFCEDDKKQMENKIDILLQFQELHELEEKLKELKIQAKDFPKVNFKVKNNISSIIKEIQRDCNDSILIDEMMKAFNLWVFYSKYEHIGLYSYNFSREHNAKDILRNIISTINLTNNVVMKAFNYLESNKLDQS